MAHESSHTEGGLEEAMEEPLDELERVFLLLGAGTGCPGGFLE